MSPWILQSWNKHTLYKWLFFHLQNTDVILTEFISLLQMTEQFCCTLASNSIQCKFRSWISLWKHSHVWILFCHWCEKPHNRIYYLISTAVFTHRPHTLNSSLISGLLRASSLNTWLAPMNFSLSLSCVKLGLSKGKHNEEVINTSMWLCSIADTHKRKQMKTDS